MIPLALLVAAAAPVGTTDPTKAPVPVVRLNTPAIEPAKAEVARSVAARLLPDGISRDILSSPFNATVVTLAHSYLMMPVEQFASSVGVTLPQEGVSGPPLVHVRILRIIDPANAERTTIVGKVISEMAADAAVAKEPEVRNALAVTYSSQLSFDQLKALDNFLATPAGAAFARTNAMLGGDPYVLAAMSSQQRAIAAAMPAMLVRLSEETKSLTPIKSAEQLTPAERKQIADLLHIDQSRLEGRQH